MRRHAASSAQRTAVKQRPHQETTGCRQAMTEPVVLHHGREGGPCRRQRGAADCFNGLLASSRRRDLHSRYVPRGRVDVNHGGCASAFPRRNVREA